MPTAALHSYFWSGVVISPPAIRNQQTRVPDMWGWPTMNFYSQFERPPAPFMYQRKEDEDGNQTDW